MADVPAPTPPPPPPPPAPPGDLLGDSILQTPSISGRQTMLTPSQSGSSLQSAAGSEAASITNDKDTPGKRPATIEEIRQSARKWSLAGDAGVLLYLRQFSQNMIRKTHELENVVDNLAYETKGLDSKVHNTFNDFLMLSNKQFIENRVYDEEISQEDTTEKDTPQQIKTREQLEAEILPRFSQAVNLGLQVLEDAFITVEIKPGEESDDEDEEGLPAGYVPDPIIEPKDMYISRPLPHLIGTAEFFSDDTLGLIEYDDEEEETKKTAKEEDESESSESETSESESEYTESSEEEEEELKKRPDKKQLAESSESEEESDEDLFAEKKKDEQISDEETDESEDEETSQPKPKMAIQKELAAKLGLQGQAPTAKVAEDKDDKSDTQSVTSKRSTADTKSVSSALETENAEAGTKVKSESKHRTASKRSEGGHRKHKGSVKHQHHHHHHHKKEEEDLESDDEDLFGGSKVKEDENKIEDDSPFQKKGGMFSGGGMLFGDESEGDLFGDIEKTDLPSTSIEKPQEPETPTEIKPRIKTTSSGKKLPAGAVSLFGDANLFGGTGDTKEPTIKVDDAKEVAKETKKPPPIVKGLFNDDDYDDEGDLFDSKPKSSSNLQEPPKQKRKKTLEFFDDKEEDSLFRNDNKQKGSEEQKKFDAKTDNTEGLFAATEKEKSQKSKPEEKKATSKPKVLSLFDDDDDAAEEDWFDNLNPSKNLSKTQPPKMEAKDMKKPQMDSQNVSPFSEPNDSKAPTVEKVPSKKPSKSKKVVSLFEDEAEEDLFDFSKSAPTKQVTKAAKTASAKGKEEKEEDTVDKSDAKKYSQVENTGQAKDVKSEVKVKSSKHKTRSLIDDSSGLFGDDQDDLFTAPTKKSTPATETSANKKKSAKGGGLSFLEDDDGEDDLFGVPSTKSKKKQEVKTAIEPQLQAPTTEGKWEVEISKNRESTTGKNKGNEAVTSSNVVGDDDDDDDLFKGKTISSEKQVSDVPPEKEVEDSPVEVEASPKPKKLAGAVSLFGGIDPFAAKKTLRSASKETIKSPVPDITNNDDLRTNTTFPHKSQPAHSEPTAQAPAPSQSSKPESKKATKEEVDGPKRNETKKLPKIAFDPATLVPGAAPPLRVVEPPPASFDDPPPLQVLTNPNKDRAKIQKKRRPPSRQLRQGVISTDQPHKTADVPGTILESPPITKVVAPEVESKQKTQGNVKSSIKQEDVSSSKGLKVEDIFSDDDGGLFSIESKSPKKQEDKKASKILEKTETPTKVSADEQTLSKAADREDFKKSLAKPNDLFGSDTSEADDIFSDKKATVNANESTGGDKNNLETGRKRAEIMEDLSHKEKSESTKSKESEATFTANLDEEEEEELFKATEKKEKTTAEKDTRNKKEEITKRKKEEAVKVKKKKDKANIFDEEIEEDLFGGKSKKKEERSDGAKKTKKATKTVTDEDLFGDSGSIFETKPKDKKKKKAENAGKDIFNSKDDDIFATEKKAKTKKKAEKTTKTKLNKPQANDGNGTPNIFEDPLNALGGE